MLWVLAGIASGEVIITSTHKKVSWGNKKLNDLSYTCIYHEDSELSRTHYTRKYTFGHVQ